MLGLFLNQINKRKEGYKNEIIKTNRHINFLDREIEGFSFSLHKELINNNLENFYQLKKFYKEIKHEYGLRILEDYNFYKKIYENKSKKLNELTYRHKELCELTAIFNKYKGVY